MAPLTPTFYHRAHAICKRILAVIVFGIAWSASPMLAQANYELNAAGGDCHAIGTWIDSERTCILTQDITSPIVITGNFVTLDGAGHTIDLTNSSFIDWAVHINGMVGVTVKNTVCKGKGIYFEQAENGQAIHNEIEAGGVGIGFFNLSEGLIEGNVVRGKENNPIRIAIDAEFADHTVIRGNQVTYADKGLVLNRADHNVVEQNLLTAVEIGILVTYTDNGTIAGNVITDADTGFELRTDNTVNNAIRGNTFEDSRVGVVVVTIDAGGPTVVFIDTTEQNTGSFSSFLSSWWQRLVEAVMPEAALAQAEDSNVFFQNKFSNNDVHVVVPEWVDVEVAFSRPLPEGGNYWDVYDEEGEGCEDVNEDGFCDLPYEVSGNLLDEFPRATPAVVEPVLPQCSDTIDNDGDGLIDFPDDPGCTAADDIIEINAPAPTCIVFVSPNIIESGTSANLSWTSEQANTAVINNDIGTVTLIGELEVRPTTTTTYVATFTGSGGEAACQTTLTVTAEPEQEPELTLGEKAAELAKQLVNQPDGYYYGGKGWDYDLAEFTTPERVLNGYTKLVGTATSSITGVDCSGLVMWAFNRAFNPNAFFLDNFITYEASHEQVSSAQSIIVDNENDLHPGDILSFDFSPSSTHLVDHVAMYVGGEDREVVNATDEERGIQSFSLTIMKTLPQFIAYHRPVKGEVALRVQAGSPVDVVVTDPDGNVVSKQSVVKNKSEQYQGVAGQMYYSELLQGHDGNPADVVYSPKLKNGQYKIKVIPNTDANEDDVYSVTFIAGDTILELAKKEPLTTIPIQGFAVEIRNSGDEIEKVELAVTPNILFDYLLQQLESIESEHRFILHLLKVNVKLTERLYDNKRNKLVLAQLRQMKRLLSKLTSSADVEEVLSTIERLISAIKYE